MIAKRLVALTLYGLTAAYSHGITLEEFKAKPPEEKIAIFNEKADKVIEPRSDLLGAYIAGLNDPSKAVQKAAAQSSVYLVLGVQAVEEGILPVFSETDTRAFQQALCSHLTDSDAEIRASAALALIYAAPPNPRRETFFLRQIERELSFEIKGELLKTMVAVGYNSPAIAELALVWMRSDTDTDSYRIDAGTEALAFLCPSQALEQLIVMASKPSSSQRAALKVLAAYGGKAKAAKPALNDLLQPGDAGKKMERDVVRTFEAIVSGKPIPGSLRSHPLKRTLGPEVLIEPR